MARPKGSKNRPKVVAEPPKEDISHLSPEVKADLASMGLIDQGLVEHKEAPAAFRPEYLDVDAKLQELAFDTPEISDPTPSGLKLTQEREKGELLSDYVENYKPASNTQELHEQVFLAKQAGVDSIEGTEALIRHYTRKDFDYIKEKVGYFQFQDIKVYIPGAHAESIQRDRRDVYLNTTAAKVGK
jgi:hypothetical protein